MEADPHKKNGKEPQRVGYAPNASEGDLKMNDNDITPIYLKEAIDLIFKRSAEQNFTDSQTLDVLEQFIKDLRSGAIRSLIIEKKRE